MLELEHAVKPWLSEKNESVVSREAGAISRLSSMSADVWTKKCIHRAVKGLGAYIPALGGSVLDRSMSGIRGKQAGLAKARLVMPVAVVAAANATKMVRPRVLTL